MPKPEPIIIGLTGPKGAGKDTVADFLVEQHGYARLAFADALRLEICKEFDIAEQLLTCRKTKEHPISTLALNHCMDDAFVERMQQLFARGVHGHYGIAGEHLSLSAPRSPRQIMQWWGTEYRRAQRPNYWTFKLEDAIGNAYKSGQNRFVVTDVRFPDEAGMLLGLGACLWQIQRPGHEPQPGEHSSETSGAQFAPHFVLSNNASITHLHNQAYAALKKQDQLRHLTAQLAELEGQAVVEPEAATSRESHFFLAGWNGAVLNVDATDHFQKALASAPQCVATPAAPADPIDWPLPCAVTVGHGTMGKGVKLSTLVLRMKVLYKMATGEDADEVAARTPEQRAQMFQLKLATTPAAAPVVLPEQDAALLNQGIELLHALSCDERNRGNSSAAEGATASAYAVQRLAAALLATGGQAQSAQHPDDVAVDALAALMKAKLAKQRNKGYGGWDTDCTRERLSELLRGHVDKGDPVDVANFCAFLSARGEGIAPQAQADARDTAFEAVRKKFCKLQRYSFFLDDKGNVRRVPQFTGNWVEFESVHTLFEPASVDAAIEAAKGAAA